MGTIIATCGHEIKNVYYAVEYPLGYPLGTSSEVICPKCLPKYKTWHKKLKVERKEFHQRNLKTNG